MFISTLGEFLSSNSNSELELELELELGLAAEVFYVTSATFGGSQSASHFREATAEWRECKGFSGRIFRRVWCAESRTYSEELYVVILPASVNADKTA